MKIPFSRPLAFGILLSLTPIAGAQDETEAAPELVAEDARLSPEVRALIDEIKAATQAIKDEGESLERLEALGDLYLKIGEVARAVVIYEKAITDFEGTEKLFGKLSRVLGLTGRSQLTIDTLKIGLEKFPESTYLQFELGKQYVKMQKAYAAVAHLKGLVEAHPDNVEYRFFLADAYRLQEKWETADALLDQVIEADERFLQAQLMKGDILLAQGEYRDGIRYLEDVFEANPESEPAKTLLVHAYQIYAYDESTSGRMSRAVRSIRDALEVEPNNPESMVALGSFLQELGDYAESEAAFEDAMEKNPDYLEGYMVYGRLLESLDRKGEAAEVYKKGLAKSRELGVEQAIQTYRALLSGKRG